MEDTEEYIDMSTSSDSIVSLLHIDDLPLQPEFIQATMCRTRRSTSTWSWTHITSSMSIIVIDVICLAGEYVEDTEEYINIELDSSRNRLIKLEVVLTAGTFALAIFTLVGGACCSSLSIVFASAGDVTDFKFSICSGALRSCIFTIVGGAK